MLTAAASSIAKCLAKLLDSIVVQNLKIDYVAKIYSSLATVLYYKCRSEFVALVFEHAQTCCTSDVMLRKCILV